MVHNNIYRGIDIQLRCGMNESYLDLYITHRITVCCTMAKKERFWEAITGVIKIIFCRIFWKIRQKLRGFTELYFHRLTSHYLHKTNNPCYCTCLYNRINLMQIRRLKWKFFNLNLINQNDTGLTICKKAILLKCKACWDYNWSAGMSRS